MQLDIIVRLMQWASLLLLVIADGRLGAAGAESFRCRDCIMAAASYLIKQRRLIDPQLMIRRWIDLISLVSRSGSGCFPRAVLTRSLHWLLALLGLLISRRWSPPISVDHREKRTGRFT